MASGLLRVVGLGAADLASLRAVLKRASQEKTLGKWVGEIRVGGRAPLSVVSQSKGQMAGRFVSGKII